MLFLYIIVLSWYQNLVLVLGFLPKLLLDSDIIKVLFLDFSFNLGIGILYNTPSIYNVYLKINAF